MSPSSRYILSVFPLICQELSALLFAGDSQCVPLAGYMLPVSFLL